MDDAFSDADEVLSVAEDSTLTGTVLSGTSSVDGPVTVTGFNVAGDTTNYSAGQTAAIAGVGSLQINGDGTFSFIPVADYNGPVPVVSYTMTDGSSGDNSTLTINVTPVADIVNDAVTLNEDTVANIDVNANDTFENTEHTITAVNGTAIEVGGSVAVANGTVLLNANGTLSFTPALNYNGTTNFTYTVTSGGVTETATVNLTVNPINDAPANSVPGAQTTNEDMAQVFSSANGNAISLIDIDSASVTTAVSVLHGTLTVSAVVAAAAGVTVSNNGTANVTLVGAPNNVNAVLNGLIYNPIADYNGADSLTVVTSDGTLSDTDSIAITVTPVADITNDAVTLNEDTVANIDVNANDTFENTGHTITAINGTAIAVGGSVAVVNGTVLLNANGTLSFTPAANYNGTTSFTYTVTSGGVTETATVNLTVNPVNDAPINSVPGAQTTTEDTAQVFSSANGNAINLTDIDSATVTTTVSVLYGNLTALATAGVTITNNGSGTVTLTGSPADITSALNGLTYTPVADYNGVDSLTVVTTDGTLSDTDSIVITVTPVADIANDAVTLDEDTVANIDVNANDTFENTGHTITAINGTAIAVGGSVAVANGSVILNPNGTLSFTPNADYNGSTSFTYTVTSGGVTETATVNLTVNPVNEAPVNSVAGAQTINEDATRVFSSANGNAISLIDIDSATVTTTVSVLHGSLTALATAGVTITNNGTGTVILTGSPTNITTALNGLTYTPVADYNGADSLTIVTNDGTLSDTDSIAITVTPVVDIANDSVTTNEDTVVTINVNANDTFENPGHTITAINGTAIAVGGSVAVANGTVLLNANGTLSFTPAANYNGTTSFTYTVTSGGVTETATANVTVNPVNDAPSGTNTTVTTLEDTAKVFTTDNFGFSDLNDSPANTLQAVRITTLPSTGSLTLNGIAVTTGQLISATDIAAGLLVFTPAIDLNGPVTFTFQVQDSGGTANGGVNLDPTPNIMTVDVTAVADTPVIYAHLSLPTVIAGTEIIAGNFSSNNNENNFSNWSKVALFSSTFAEIQGGNNKTSSEADLFNNIAWAGETGSNSTEVSNFNSRWSKTGGAIVYNTNDLADDAQGILLLNSNQLTSAERNLTNYVISLDMFADADSPRVNGIGIVFGYQNSSNYFLVRWENPSIEYSPGGIFYNLHPGQYHEFTLVQIVNNVPIDLARTTFNADDWFHVDINVSNLGISVSAVDTSDPSVVANFNYIFGSVSGAATAAPALNTIGLYSFDNDSEVRWDNINVNQPLRYEYTLQTEAYLKDVDGSETLGNITLAGIPSGVTLFDTVTNTSIPVNAGSATIIPGNDIRLVSTTALTAAQINAISASVSSVESSNGSTASQTTTVQLDLSGAYAPETFTGTNAAEWLEGGDSNDVLDARGGNDVIIGGLGNDTITTGAGADQVVLLKGQGGASAAAAPIDTITDFTVNVDTIVIKGTNIIGVAVSTPVSNTYTITVNYSGGAPTEYFKVTLSNGATLNDSGDNQLTGVVVSGGTATIDGTIVGAILYLDINGNNQEDAGERLGITDQYGHVEWVLDLTKLDVNGDGQYTLGEARAVQTGGFDIDTGLSYAINLFGPVGSSVISPLTSLLQAQLESGFDYKTANAHIVAHLGLPEGTELISLNPITGSNEILAQNASVMTAAVQFAEIAAIRYSTDEGHVSFSVFDAISKALLELPDGVVADFTDKAFLQNIASHLDLGDFVNQDVIDFMAASQRALQTSIETLAPGENALAAISEVQHLTQGSYAQTLESYMNGYLPSHLLSDISVIILAFSSSIITYEELKDFNNQFTDVVNQWMNSSTGIPLVDAEYKDTNQFVHEIDSVVNHFISAHNLYVANPVDYQQPAAEQHVNSLTELGSGEEGVIAHEVNTNEITNDLSSSMGGLELHGSTGNDFIYGGDGNDLIFGGEGDDHLYGGKGNDTIIGGSGNDIIQGGIGNDTMTGGGGNDIFVFEKADIGNEPAIDTITDFKLSKEGDASGDKSTLDLTDLFKDSTLSSNSLDSLLQISTVHNESTNQTDTVIKTDPTGGAHFNASPETIVLSGVDVVSVYGTSDSAELVQQMLAANVLVMGH
ncbi:tandem-95 repeat protein [Legionella moravica]|uniref:tandem-95 repeat protein n=1 Tax=Legionella moravica TaxID=39962 RepID=UPI0024A93E52|nr:tandem-95 repeat protein [Legionella moravica]